MIGIHSLQLTILILLVAVAVFAVLAERLSTPYPIVLVLAGLAVSALPHVSQIPLNPDLVFLIFLPPLLFAAAWQTSWREFRINLPTILTLVLGLVGATVLVIALFSDRFIGALDFRSGFLLGAVVATTDAIAATSMAASIGLPSRVVEVLEGESLLNDATGLLALEFGLQMLQTGTTPTLAHGAERLLWLSGGGIAVGLLIGVGVWFVERWIDDGPVEMIISVVAPYAAYLAAEAAHASGVLAVVACGLYLGRQSTEIFSPKTRVQIQQGWESLNFGLNGLVFLLIGLQLPHVIRGLPAYGIGTLLKYGAAFSLLLIALRMVWIFPAVRAASWFSRTLLRNRHPAPTGAESFVIGWTGMRGVVALAAAFSLPETLDNGQPFAQRDLILFLTFAVILVTLVLQGLSLPWIMSRLPFGKQGGHAEEEIEARKAVLNETIEYLAHRKLGDDAQLHRGYDHLIEGYRHRLELLEHRKKHTTQLRKRTPHFYRRYRELMQDAIDVERSTATRLRDEGAMGDALLTRIQTELDLHELRQETRS